MLIETENTTKVITNLRRYTDKPIVFNDMKELGKTYLGAIFNEEDSIKVYLRNNLTNGLKEAVFVHEILHATLDYEGFPKISNTNLFARKNFTKPLIIAASNMIRNHFSSTIQHPEIFRRMESEYSLDINSYYHEQYKQKINRFEKYRINRSSSEGEYFYMQEDILDGLNYYFWQDYGKKLLEQFKIFSPDSYTSCQSLFEKVSKTGFKTPEQCYQSANEIKRHLIAYGKRKSLKKEYNNLWIALKIDLP
ncbi:MAG: hypothetical protein AAB929_04385 [Patescibacteria group bacterium]